MIGNLPSGQKVKQVFAIAMYMPSLTCLVGFFLRFYKEYKSYRPINSVSQKRIAKHISIEL